MEKMKEKNENNPFFSLILPIYNVEDYLPCCIDSVLKQNFDDCELILVDDGATDACPEICNAYAEKHRNIRVIHKENGGLSSARNAGLEAARGEYIWWVDSDDMIEPGSLYRIYEAACTDRPDIIKFRYRRDGKPEAQAAVGPGLYRRGEGLEKLTEEAFLRPGSFCLSAWSHVYKRTFLLERRLSFVSERLVGSEDYLFNLQAIPTAETVLVLGEMLYFYRVREGSITQRYREDLADKYTELFRQLCEAYKAKGCFEAYEAKLCFFFLWHLIHGTCIGAEYRQTAHRGKKLSRKAVKKILDDELLRYAADHCDKISLTFKQRLQVMAMKYKVESLFYFLYVVKPGLWKGKIHEAEN